MLNPSALPKVVAGRYRIISQLGEGGMGVAYRAWDNEQDVPVVVKMPKADRASDSDFIERFNREIKALAGLAHPHIVPIVGNGQDEDGRPYVAMRFLPGGSLSDRRRRGPDKKPVPGHPSLLHHWLPAIAEALDFVHRSGVIHRDVKPDNIFFDARWNAFLGDFGIAKVIESGGAVEKDATMTKTGIAMGTYAYMAPEVWSNKPLAASDQYSLAVIVYEMLAGMRPFTGEFGDLARGHIIEPPPPLMEKQPQLPSRLSEAVHRALSKKPEDRFETCGEFAAAVLKGVPVPSVKDGVTRVMCPACHTMLDLDQKVAGKSGKCRKCSAPVQVSTDLEAVWLLSEGPARPCEAGASVQQSHSHFRIPTPPRSSDKEIQSDQIAPSSEARISSALIEQVGTATQAHEMGQPPADTPVVEPALQPLHQTIAERPDLSWRIAYPGGEASKPVDATAMQHWLAGGQAEGSELVWRADWADWRPVQKVFPECFPDEAPVMGWGDYLARASALAGACAACYFLLLYSNNYLSTRPLPVVARTERAVAEAVSAGRWEEALALDPRNADTYLRRAQIHLVSKPPQIDAALSDIDEADRLEPGSERVRDVRVTAIMTRARYHLTFGAANQVNAMNDVTAAEELAPDSALVREVKVSVLLVRATEHARLNRLGEAESDIKAAEKLCPPDLRTKEFHRAADALSAAWLRRVQQAVEQRSLSAIKAACDKATTVGVGAPKLITLWHAYASSCADELNSLTLSAACKEGKKYGLSSQKAGDLWLRYAERASAVPHEDVSAIREAVRTAQVEGVSDQQVKPLLAKALVIEAVNLASRGDETTAAAKMNEAAIVDAGVVAAAIALSENLALRRAVVADYRTKFDGAVANKKWNQMLQIAESAAAIDPQASGWLHTALTALSPSTFAEMPVATIAAMPTSVLAKLPPATISALPISTLTQLPPATIVALPQSALAKIAPEKILALPPIVNSIGLQLKLIPAGSFVMGIRKTDRDRLSMGWEDHANHRVTLTTPFYVGMYEVTEDQYYRVMGRERTNTGRGSNHPVGSIAWREAADFCEKLSSRLEERSAGRVYRLPTEAEWEYMCRAGTTTAYSFGDSESRRWDYSSAGGPLSVHEVGQRMSNPWGLYDTYGNVEEWCSDWYGEYPKRAVVNPQGPREGTQRVARGGGSRRLVRSGHRDKYEPTERHDERGFRVVMMPSEAGHDHNRNETAD